MKIGLLFDRNNDWISKYLLKKNFGSINGKIIKVTTGNDIKKINNHEVLFILGYTKKISNEDLLRNKLNLVVHESNLPRDKGFSPIQYQILKGKNNLKVSLIVAEAEIDKGPIILTLSFFKD